MSIEEIKNSKKNELSEKAEEKQEKAVDIEEVLADNEVLRAELIKGAISERQDSIEKIKTLGEKYEFINVSSSIEEIEKEVESLENKMSPKEKTILEEEIDTAEKVSGRPVNKENTEILKKEAVAGLEQDDKKQKEGEGRIISETESPNDEEGKEEQVKKNHKDKKAEDLEISKEFLENKIKNSDFIDSVKGLTNILKAREQNGFYSLVNPEAIPYLQSAISDIEELITSKKSRIEDITNCVKRMCGAVNAIGVDLKKTGQLIESNDALNRVGYNLRNLSESSKHIMVEIGGQENLNLEESIRYFKALVNLTEEKMSFIASKRQLLNNIG